MLIGSLFFILNVFNSAAHASGYEKPVLWSGKFGGLAGASVSSVTGPESIAFNPAGLAGVESIEAGVAFTPFWFQKQGPVVPGPSATVGAGSIWGEGNFVTTGGGFVAKKINDRLGVGFGFFASGGGAGQMGNIDFGANYPTLHPAVGGALKFTDVSLGAGYEVLPGLRLGAAWRVVIVEGSAQGAAPLDTNNDGVPDLLFAFDFENLKATRFNAFRFGAEYEPESKSWGAGASVRTGITFDAKGTSSGQSQASGSSTINALSGGDITFSTGLPWQLATGVHFVLAPNWRLFTEYDYTNYQSNQQVTYSGAPLGGVSPALFSSAQDWLNLHTFRLATEYFIDSQDLALRAGYALTTQVTPTNHANISILPPGMGQCFTAGAGTHFLQKAMGVDVALDYSPISGAGSGSTLGYLDGQYSLWALAVHTSVSYRF